MPSASFGRFALDPSVTYLNHGSFGACPHEVLDAQQKERARMEANPVRYFLREAPARIDAARERIASLLRCNPEDLVFVRNATQAVNTVLASIGPALQPGDELLTTDHAYGACRNALEHVAARYGARVVLARVPFPLSDPDEVLEAVLGAASERTRLALLDHVTSPTGLVFPIERLVEALRARGIETLVDGAHAVGMLDVDLDRLGAAYYTSNLHKWLCAPKGCAVLHVRRDRQADLRPLAVGHGATSRRPRPRLWEEFDWQGTDDPSPWICAPVALDVLQSLLAGGLPAVRERNRALALWARARLCASLGIAPPAPESMIAALVTVPLPDSIGPPPAPQARSAFDVDPLAEALEASHRIVVPVFSWPAPPARLLRVSCAIYVDRDDVERLIAALRNSAR